MDVQSQFRLPADHLELRLMPEADGRWYVQWRLGNAARALHRDDWQAVPHCSLGEAEDVVAAVALSFMQAPEV